MDEDVLVFSIFVAVSVVVILFALIAGKFEKIANMKGHNGYFWWCFLLGAAGWAMVIALPDRGASLSCDPLSADQPIQRLNDDLPEL